MGTPTAAGNADTSGADAASPHNPVEDTATVLLSTFVVVLAGYLSRRSGMLPPVATGVVGTIVNNVCLPALVFSSMAQMPIDGSSGITAPLLAALFAGKLVAFALGALFVFASSRKSSSGARLRKAAIYALACSTSNDIPIGVPIMSALLPDMVGVLFLTVGIQLAVTAPIAFAMIEVGQGREAAAKHALEAVAPTEGGDRATEVDHRARRGGATSTRNTAPLAPMSVSAWAIALQTLRRLATNPVMVSVVLGLIVNALTGHALPAAVVATLRVPGNAVQFGMLFAVGMGMFGQLSSVGGREMLHPLYITIVKLVVSPLVMRLVIMALGSADGATATTFVWVYGLLPLSPVVAVWARQYSVEPAQMGVTVALSLALSAPMLFVTTVLVGNTDNAGVALAVAFTQKWLGLASMVAALVLLCTLLASRKVRSSAWPMDLIAGMCVTFASLALCNLACESPPGSRAVFAAVYLGYAASHGALCVYTLLVAFVFMSVVTGMGHASVCGAMRRRPRRLHAAVWLVCVAWHVALFAAHGGVVPPAIGTLPSCANRVASVFPRVQQVTTTSRMVAMIACLVLAQRRYKRDSEGGVNAVDATSGRPLLNVQAESEPLEGDGASQLLLGGSDARSVAVSVDAGGSSGSGDSSGHGGGGGGAHAAPEATVHTTPDAAADGLLDAAHARLFQLVALWGIAATLTRAAVFAFIIGGDNLTSGVVIQLVFVRAALFDGNGLFVAALFLSQSRLVSQVLSPVWDVSVRVWRRVGVGQAALPGVMGSAGVLRPQTPVAESGGAKPWSLCAWVSECVGAGPGAGGDGGGGGGGYMLGHDLDSGGSASVLRGGGDPGPTAGGAYAAGVVPPAASPADVSLVLARAFVSADAKHMQLLAVAKEMARDVHGLFDDRIGDVYSPGLGLQSERRVFHSSGVASALVSWLVAQGFAADRVQGASIGAAMTSAGILRHVTGDFGFGDDHHLFVFSVTAALAIAADEAVSAVEAQSIVGSGASAGAGGVGDGGGGHSDDGRDASDGAPATVRGAGASRGVTEGVTGGVLAESAPRARAASNDEAHMPRALRLAAIGAAAAMSADSATCRERGHGTSS